MKWVVNFQKCQSPLAFLFLVSVAVLSHWEWFNPASILTAADWYFWHDEPAGELISTWGPWLSYWGMGNPNPQIPFLVFKAIWSAIVQLGGSYDLAVKITFLWPIAIFGFVAPYCYARWDQCRQFESVALALFYGSTSYFLVKQTAHLPIALVYALAPLAIILAIRVAQEFKLGRLLVFALFLSFLIGIEIRVTLVLLVVLLLVSLKYVQEETRLWRQLTILGVVSLLLNAYWLLPMLLSNVAGAVSSITSRPLFGDHLFSILHALLLHESSWTGGFPDQDFVNQSPQLVDILVVCCMVLLLLVVLRATENDRLDTRKIGIFSFMVVWLLGVFLTKQSGQPFQELYPWAYRNLPAFNLYREAGKFYMITALGMLGVLACALSVVSKRTAWLISCLLVLVSAVNLKPAITGELRTLFVTRAMPHDYVVLREFLRSDTDSFRVLWVPLNSRWSYFDKLRGNMAFVPEIQGDWQELSDLKVHGNWLEALAEAKDSGLHEKLVDAAIKYVVVPLADRENEDNYYRFYGGEPKHWQTILDKASYLRRVGGGFGRVAVYQVEGWQSRGYALDGAGKRLPVTLDTPVSGVYELGLNSSITQQYDSLHLIERNDGGWYACRAEDWLRVALLGCPGEQQLPIHDIKRNHLSIFPANASITNTIFIIHDSVRWFWTGLLASGATMLMVLLLLFGRFARGRSGLGAS